MEPTSARTYFLTILITLLAILTVYMLRPFLVTIGLASIFAVIFTPLHNRFLRAKMSDTFAALATLLVGTICTLLPLIFISLQLFKEAQNVYSVVTQPGTVTHIQGSLTHLGQSLEPTFPGAAAYFTTLAANINTYIQVALSWVLAHAENVFTGTLEAILALFVFMMTLYYLLKEGGRLKSAIARFSPLTKEETTTLVTRMVRTITSIVRGTFVISLIQGVLTAIGFLIFGIPNAVLWGALAIFAALVPSVGVALVFIPGILYLFAIGHTGSAVGLLLYGTLGVGVVDNFLRPYLLGGSASIHPLLVLLAVLGGVSFFGPGGLFLGPLVMSLLLGLLSIYAVGHTEHEA